MSGLLSEEDLAGLTLVEILEFDTTAEREAYIRDRGWSVRE